ncbi:MAG: hypothetical protein GX942_02675, partial [Papillibacter sp.]|nr:hypothetical protein [Papillibacter sp.]
SFTKVDNTESPQPGSIISIPGITIISANAILGDSFSEDGAYTIAFRIKDLNGSTSAYAVMYVLRDSTAPTLEDPQFYEDEDLQTLLSGYTLKNTERAKYSGIDHFFGQTAYIETTADDASLDTSVYGRFTGTLRLEYTISDGSAPAANAEWQDYNNYLAVPLSGNDFTGTVWFRATDRAGNTTPVYKDSGRLMVNLNAPQAISSVNIQRIIDGSPEAYTDVWSDDDILYTLTCAELSDTDLDQFQYSYKVGEGEYSDWYDFPNTDLSIADNKLILDEDFGATVNGIITVRLRAVSHTGVTGPEYVCSPVKKDSIKPELVVTASANAGTDPAAPLWTKDDVTFTLSNAADNTSPLTYSVIISGVNEEEPIDLVSDGQEIIVYTEGEIQGKAIWDAETNTLTFTGDFYNNNSVAFSVRSAAGLSDTADEIYYVSIQQSTEHLEDSHVLSLEDLIVSEQPLGPAAAEGSPDWCKHWYNSYNSAYPYVSILNPSKFYHAVGAPVYIYYTLTAQDGESVSGSLLTDSSSSSDELFRTAADGSYTFEVWTQDAAGNIGASITNTLYIDRSAPTGLTVGPGAENWLKAAASPSFKWFYNIDPALLNISSDAAVSGLKSYAYILRETAGLTDDYLTGFAYPSADDEGWLPLSSSNLTLPENFMGVVYIKAEDKAGNIVIAGTDGIAVDDDAPIVSTSINTVPKPGFTWYDENPNISVTVNENINVASGLASVVAYERRDGTILRTITLYENTEDELKTDFTGSYTTETQGEFETYLLVTDRAGNITTTEPTALKVDSQVPVLAVELTTSLGEYTSGTWVNRNVTATLSATNNISAVTFYYSDNGG